MSQARRYCFTINNPDLNESIINLDTFQHARYIIYQFELGAQSTPHIQGYVEFERPRRLAALRAELPRAHWESAKGTAEQNRVYCSKPEGRLGGPFIHGLPGKQGKRNDLEDYRDAVRKGSSDAELINEFPATYARYPRLRAAITLADRTRPPAALEQLYDWQLEIMSVLELEPHPRKILWIWDEIGNVGKTAFAKHLAATKDIFYCTGGKHADILFAYGLQKYVVFDLPRGYKDKVPYGVLESLKNGCVFSCKYESRTLFFPTPHVIVLANFEPERSELSNDRWDVRNIIIDGLQHIMTI